MEIRHITINEDLSILVKDGHITINAIDKKNGSGLSFSLPPEFSQNILKNGGSNDEILTFIFQATAIELNLFRLITIGSLYSTGSLQEKAENTSIIMNGLRDINLKLMKANQRRIK